ncbi:hypothetical protein EVB79_009 [Rhizobium phage RHph_N3_13]|nr:hypothetical protein EVB79_009 [Rhizobium phage RHph_N3_13]QIG69837.1 hypothetical protein F67_I3_11_011 [Rhizobium phage RHph_I3_11]
MMHIKKTQRTYDRFGARGTTTRYYWRDNPIDAKLINKGYAWNGSNATVIGPVIFVGLLLLALFGIFF